MSEESQVFLETSIQIARLLQTRKRQETIRQNLLGKDIHTSLYVLMEFRRTILQDICFVHSIVETECETDANAFILLSNLERELASGKGNYSVRSAKRSRLVTAAIMDEFPFRRVSKSELLDFLGLLIEQLESEFLEVDFNDPITPEVPIHCLNETHCDLATDDFHCRVGRMSCSRTNAKCSLLHFLEAHRDEVFKVRQAFEKAPNKKQDVKLMAAVDRVIASDSWEIALGQKNCWPLSDTIIGLVAPQNAPIYTLDHHFDVICEALGKERYKEQTPPS